MVQLVKEPCFRNAKTGFFDKLAAHLTMGGIFVQFSSTGSREQNSQRPSSARRSVN